VPSLIELGKVAEVVSVVTRPDRPRGRGRKPQPSPVKVAAQSLGYRVFEAAAAADIGSIDFDVDLAVVTAFGVIIPDQALAQPRHGFINVHFSLLPRWRGAAPVAAAIAAGDEETGVTLMQLDRGLDTGPLLAARSVVIGDEENAGELTDRLGSLGGSLLVETIPALVAGELMAMAQDESKATYAPRLGSEDRLLDLRESAEVNARRVRALSPRPGAVLMLDGSRLGVSVARAAPGSLPSGLFRKEGGRLFVGAGDAPLELVAVRPPGRREMSGAEWARGWRRPPVIAT
jgi:methionyl-tRNA formyltransferase